MTLNLTGISAALATFFGVWLGHVAVRKIERETVNLWTPAAIALASGIGLEVASFMATSKPLSAALGILGVTLLWDAFEFYRQQKRIKTGHAPANPDNPRHARILADYPQATTFDWLDRNPRGRAYSTEEMESIKGGAR